MKQAVVALLTRAPYGRVHVAEGLRAARGVASGFDRHDVTVVFTEDGTYAARAAIDREAVNMTDHIEDLLAEGGRMVADAAALEARDIPAEDIADDIEVVSEARMAELLTGADHTLDF